MSNSFAITQRVLQHCNPALVFEEKSVGKSVLLDKLNEILAKKQILESHLSQKEILELNDELKQYKASAERKKSRIFARREPSDPELVKKVSFAIKELNQFTHVQDAFFQYPHQKKSWVRDLKRYFPENVCTRTPSKDMFETDQFYFQVDKEGEKNYLAFYT